MLQRLFIFICLIFVTGVGLCAPVLNNPYPPPNTQPVITIIMDDIGIHHARSQRALHLPGALTYAILPHARYAHTLATEAHELNKEVILHLPMQAINNRALDPGGLTQEQNQQQFLAVLRDNLNRIPHIRGVNNHMGSLLTQKIEPMQWLMKELARQKNLFFIDSRTSANSVGFQQAQRHGLASLRRNIFLDNDTHVSAINRQFMKLLKIARQQGSALAIAHPYPATLSYLEHMLPALPLLGIRLIPASQMIAHKARANQPSVVPLQTAELKTINVPTKTSPQPPRLVH